MEEKLHIESLKDMLNKTYDLYENNIAYKIKEDGMYKTYTHKEVRDKVTYLGTKLIDMGLNNKRIAVIGDNSMYWEIAYLAVVCGVGVVVPIDKTLPACEIERVIKISEASAVMTVDKTYDELKRISKLKDNNLKYVISLENRGTTVKELIESGQKLYNKGKTEYDEQVVKASDMASMLFTSGTTSKSKVVALSHENLCTNLMDLSHRIDITADDVFLSVLPVHHAFECTFGFLLPIYLGSCITFGDGLRHIIDNLKEYKVSVMACVPAIYESILKNINRNLDKLNLREDYSQKVLLNKNSSMEKKKEVFSAVHDMLGNNIKYFISGAAYLNANIESSFRDYGINLMQGYGLTETSPVLSICSNASYRLGSVGKAVDGIDAIIDNPNAEGVGELIVKGKSVMMGYFLDDKFDRSAFKNDYFYTGDLARIDEDGYIYICGRKKDTIVLKNGKNIYPEEIEYLINKVDGVKESLIYSLTQDKSDVKINARIVFDRNVMLRDYHAYSDTDIYNALFNEIKKINKTIPEYKAIKGIVLTEEPLIRTSTNKIKRQENILAMNLA